ncbi:MAG: N-acetyl-gamma-glutamyl-phosphate reductase, partial [Acidimicrobiales bacterium]
MVDVGIIGASGYTGAELLRLCALHPELDVRVATGDTQAGTAVAELYPSLGAAYGHLTFASYDPTDLEGLDLVFLGLPHGASQGIVPELVGKVGHLVDLGADFRLQDPSLYPAWYGAPHTAPDLLPDFAYGLPELCRDQIRAADHVATPG